jgi:hypothetical protein
MMKSIGLATAAAIENVAQIALAYAVKSAMGRGPSQRALSKFT